MVEKIARKAIHIITGNRKANYKKVAEIAKSTDGMVVLEIGSGKQENGKYPYSTEHLFKNCKKFIQTDIIPEFGHKVLDITKFKDSNKYDLILCLNVLEHVYEYQKAVDNLHKALTKRGTLVIAVPFAFPLHDEPGDYWRFTEHSLRKILASFNEVKIQPHRSRRLPTTYFITAKKG
jgi:SAM-dependent methyltransferase